MQPSAKPIGLNRLKLRNGPHGDLRMGPRPRQARRNLQFLGAPFTVLALAALACGHPAKACLKRGFGPLFPTVTGHSLSAELLLVACCSQDVRCAPLQRCLQGPRFPPPLE